MTLATVIVTLLLFWRNLLELTAWIFLGATFICEKIWDSKALQIAKLIAYMLLTNSLFENLMLRALVFSSPRILINFGCLCIMTFWTAEYALDLKEYYKIKGIFFV